MNKTKTANKKTAFVAINIIEVVDGKTFVLISGANGEAIAQMGITDSYAQEMCKKLGISIVNVKTKKQWQEDAQEDAAGQGKAAALQLNGSTTLQEEEPGSDDLPF
jgi:hypothetical protein